MGDKQQISIRFHAALLRRLDRVIPALAKDPQLAALGPIDRSKAIRILVTRALEDYEERRP